ncbi:MAG: hypothetical protein HRU15_00955 [Planctomycetes bacterium]|nr:hypothetical protein [Planctomycetota bacterium]
MASGASRRPADNPFRSSCLHDIPYRFQEQDLSVLYDRMWQLGGRVMLCGPHGSGKTCLSEALSDCCRAAGIAVHCLQIHGNCQRPAYATMIKELESFKNNHFIVVDGADLLSSLSWFRLRKYCRRFSGLLVTSHRKNLLPLLFQHQPKVDDFIYCLEYLDPRQEITVDAQYIFKQCQGNIRDALRHCYQLWQNS